MDRARMKLGDKVTIPAVVEEIEHTTLGEIRYKVEPLNTWFDADEIEAVGQTESEGVAGSATTTECISRQQAVEAVTNTIREKLSLADWYEQLVETGLEIENLIKELPPVTPTERTGEWIVHSLIDDGRVELECSECGDTFVRAADYRPHFCEHCGAKMKG